MKFQHTGLLLTQNEDWGGSLTVHFGEFQRFLDFNFHSVWITFPCDVLNFSVLAPAVTPFRLCMIRACAEVLK